MQQEIISNFSQYGKTAVNSAKELLAINGRMLEKMLESQISLAKICVESSEQQLNIGELADSPTDMLSKQTALVEEFSGKLVDATQASSDIAKTASAEFKVWFEKGLKVADAAVKETQTTVVAATADIKTAAAPAVKTVPTVKTTPAAKKAAAKPAIKTKPAAKKSAASVAAKPTASTTAKKTAANTAAKQPSEKAPAKKAAATKSTATKSPVKKATAKKAPTKKTAIK